MSAQRTMFVNKQFNSPINLYSPQAIQEALDRQTQVLSNGAVGIDFNQLAKPANLQNSAVLRMLEEEEARQRAGQAGLKRVAWPPPPEDQDFDFVEQGPVQAKQHSQDYTSLRSIQNQAPTTFEAPPSTIILRPEPPISQAPAPVYQAQPAATKAPISGNMRGDLKWPPPSVKAQAEAENRARMELAKGPAFRPRRVQKDYSGFFAQHALNNTYPGYRAPPGTQYFTPSYHH
ncbi:PDZ and LIM domain protein Zasp isoform X5 [Apis mellifera]|uniref:PDZ and LIM domain protein Zasp isoform X5 n=1 Tax=Apis mellifera TaxID=7460 RepID=A0A7M7IGQ5_APIME|nr:PDZ and LIM domain protein Zasp isoform X5 [Apis mellifera]|eukprot:XP_016768682.1 PDZ and LIM domain protein Zasp isoform X5 [Apis mellifera]